MLFKQYKGHQINDYTNWRRIKLEFKDICFILVYCWSLKRHNSSSSTQWVSNFVVWQSVECQKSITNICVSKLIPHTAQLRVCVYLQKTAADGCQITYLWDVVQYTYSHYLLRRVWSFLVGKGRNVGYFFHFLPYPVCNTEIADSSCL